jgi:hypothetical protein
LKESKIQVEPSITVNGYLLNSAQAMTVRVALQDMAMSLEANGLGDDEHGRQMARLYTERIREINRVISAERPVAERPVAERPAAEAAKVCGFCGKSVTHCTWDHADWREDK